MKLNRVIFRDANLSFSTDKFSEKYARCAIFSHIDFFLGYDQVELDKESQNIIALMTLLGPMRITTLPQSATNSVILLIKIILIILTPYLQERTKLFFDDVRIKKQKNKYNNEELALEIRRYVLKYIQNLDMVLAVLE